MSFQTYIRAAAPGYMSGGRWASVFLESVGITLDAYAERTLLGRAAAIPFSGGAKFASGLALQCEPDALPYHARDRQLTLYPTEPLASRRYRLSRWRQIHAQRGTHRGALNSLQPYFLPGALPRIRIVHQAGDGASADWHTISGSSDPGGAGIYTVHRASPSNWDFDGQDAQWSRFWVILYVNGSSVDGGETEYDDGSTYNGGQVYDGVPAANVFDMIGILNDSKAAHSIMWGFIVTSDLMAFDPTATATVLPDGSTTLPIGNWGPIIDPVTHLPTRPPYAHFYLDLGQG